MKTMAAPKKRTEKQSDDRVTVIVLKDTPEYRDWAIGLSDETLIDLATITRDALQMWAAARGLKPAPSGPRRRR
jgi:hypothetical protein